MTYPFSEETSKAYHLNVPRVKWMKITWLSTDETTRHLGFVMEDGKCAFTFVVNDEMLEKMAKGILKAIREPKSYADIDLLPDPITLEGGRPRLANGETSS